MEVYHLVRPLDTQNVAWNENKFQLYPKHVAIQVGNVVYEFTTTSSDFSRFLGKNVEGVVLIDKSKPSEFKPQPLFQTDKSHFEIRQWIEEHKQEFYNAFTNNCQSFALGLLKFLDPKFDPSELVYFNKVF